MTTTTTPPTPSDQSDRYGGDILRRLRADVQRVRDQFQPAHQTPGEVHHFADQLRELHGGLTVAHELTPRLKAEHRLSVQRQLEHVRLAARRVREALYVDPTDRVGIDHRLTEIGALVDADDLAAAESALVALTQRIEQVLMAGATLEYESLLAAIEGPVTVQ